MKPEVRAAFVTSRHGFSADRVVADAELNEVFLRACRANGLTATPLQLNLCLLNLRKAGELAGLPKSKRTSFNDEPEYRHASEIATRFLETREQTTLDRIICDPMVAEEFDKIAYEICPGHSSLQYWWAALNLRKRRMLRPELLARVVHPSIRRLGLIDNLDLSSVPTAQGVYVFYNSSETLYIGEAKNLNKRVAKHLDHSDNKKLARWFWDHGFGTVFLELRILVEGTGSDVRKALEAELIQSRVPRFNVQGITR